MRGAESTSMVVTHRGGWVMVKEVPETGWSLRESRRLKVGMAAVWLNRRFGLALGVG